MLTNLFYKLFGSPDLIKRIERQIDNAEHELLDALRDEEEAKASVAFMRKRIARLRVNLREAKK